ncbi:MAG: LOG family protein [Leptonema sp. (in: bacteria)]
MKEKKNHNHKKKERPLLAFENLNFLLSEEARPIRILSEYLYPLKKFNEFGITDTIIFFGSARIPSPEQKERFRNSKIVELISYYEQAKELARRITLWSKNVALKHKRRFIICSGGGPGIMEASNRGAYEAEGISIGLNIELPKEQLPNPYITKELNFDFHYFFTRKYWFLYFARVLIAFPGGFGTLDELFETLTLQQTKNLKNTVPVYLYGEDFWKRLIDFDFLVEYDLISPEDTNLFKIVNSVEEAYTLIVRDLEKNL